MMMAGTQWVTRRVSQEGNHERGQPAADMLEDGASPGGLSWRRAQVLGEGAGPGKRRGSWTMERVLGGGEGSGKGRGSWSRERVLGKGEGPRGGSESWGGASWRRERILEEGAGPG